VRVNSNPSPTTVFRPRTALPRLEELLIENFTSSNNAALTAVTQRINQQSKSR